MRSHAADRAFLHPGGAIATARLSIAAALLMLLLAGPALAADGPTITFSDELKQLDRAVDWSQARLLAVQEGGRFKTLESFARESMSAMTGRERLPGLSPIASALEWAFNFRAYADSAVIRVKDLGVRIHLTAHMPDAQRERIRASKFMTLRELLDPTVQQRIQQIAALTKMAAASRRVAGAQAVALNLERALAVVTRRTQGETRPWFTPEMTLVSLPAPFWAETGTTPERFAAEREIPAALPELTAEQAAAVAGPWFALREAWLARDAARVQANLDELVRVLPTLGYYPTLSQRGAEARYYAFGKFIWGYWVYLLGAIVSVAALATGWRRPWLAGMALLVVALGLHAYGVSLRWFILGRIPVANMFEAVTWSAWIGVTLGLLAEWLYPKRLFLLASHLTGFFALVIAHIALDSDLTTIRGILDDIMLRIHTTLIISSYALIFLASVLALVYLFGYYFVTAPQVSAESGMLAGLVGLGLVAMGLIAFTTATTPETPSGVVKDPRIQVYCAVSAGLAAAAIVLALRYRVQPQVVVTLCALLVAFVAGAIGNRGFIVGLGWTMTLGGAAWAAANLLGRAWRARPAPALATVLAGGTDGGALTGAPVAFAGAAGGAGRALGGALRLESQRPILAGAAPGDEGKADRLPQWLYDCDWSHLIILNIVFVALFIGIILGAVWADYSWGRPWGWDPKEVFAMNTWIIYAILIHVRFIVAKRGLWTAWLSVAGCLMMAFNWCFVNFFIVGLHSYA